MKYKKKSKQMIALMVVLAILLTGGAFALGTISQAQLSLNQSGNSKIGSDPFPIDDLINSIEHLKNNVQFQIPFDFPNLEKLNIHIAGRAVYADGFSKSLHFLESENETKSWKAGATYTVPLEKNYTELTMDIYYPEADGTITERSIDLLRSGSLLPQQ